MELTTIAPRELAALCAEGNPIDLIDVRTPVEYRELHVPQARNVPLDQLNPAGLIQSRKGSAEAPLYLICRSGSRGQQACEQLRRAGLSQVVNVEGGTLAWAAADLPVVHGKKAISLERQVRIAAGSLVLLGTLLGWLVHPACVALAAFVGAGLIFSGITELARRQWFSRTLLHCQDCQIGFGCIGLRSQTFHNSLAKHIFRCSEVEDRKRRLELSRQASELFPLLVLQEGGIDDHRESASQGRGRQLS